MKKQTVWVYQVKDDRTTDFGYIWMFSANPDYRVVSELRNDIKKQDKIPPDHLVESFHEMVVDVVEPEYNDE